MKTKPLPIGYIEIQRSMILLAPEEAQRALRGLLQEIREQVSREYPGYVQHGARTEFSLDGVGVSHTTVYMGFVPPPEPGNTTEPLNPHNLNETTNPYLPATETAGGPLGAKETKF